MDDFEKINKLFGSPEIKNQIEALQKMNINFQIFDNFSPLLQDVIKLENISTKAYESFESSNLKYREDIEKIANLGPHKLIKEQMTTGLRNDIEKYEWIKTLSEIASQTSKDIFSLSQSLSKQKLKKIKEANEHVIDMFNQNNVVHHLDNFRPYFKTLAPLINEMVEHKISSPLPELVFTAITSKTETLAESVIELKRIGILPFQRVTENRIRNLYGDDALINQVKYEILPDAPQSQYIIENKHGDSYQLELEKDRRSLKGFLPTISEREINKFIDFLGSFPMLGLKNKVGKLLFGELKKNWLSYTDEVEEETVFYRSRNNGEDGVNIPTQQMFEAPYGIPGVGRFNPLGINYLYLADTLKTAKAELGFNKNKTKGITSISAKNRKPLRLFSLDGDRALTFSYCLRKDSGMKSNYHTYFLPNFLSQCLSFLISEEEIRLDGIKYPSSKGSEESYCFVLFNHHRDDFKDIERVF